MPAYQFYNPAPVFHDLLGVEPATNGTLEFYDIGTTTPRNTWSDYAMTTLNANPLTLGPDGRTPVQLWFLGDYTVVCKNALGSQLWTREVRQQASGTASSTIPTLDAGKFLSNDGLNLVWEALPQIPDPTGSTSHYLTTDGSNLIWVPIPTAPTAPNPEVVIGANSFRAGTSASTTKFFVQAGTGSAPATGAKGTSVNINFGTAFSAEPWIVVISLRIGAATPSGALVDKTVTAKSSTGFTAGFNVSDDDTNSAWKISNAIDFDWVAIGTVVVP